MIDWEDSSVAPDVIASGTGAGGEAIETVEIEFPFFLSNGRKSRWARTKISIAP